MFPTIAFMISFIQALVVLPVLERFLPVKIFAQVAGGGKTPKTKNVDYILRIKDW
jgi:hypothetical protein